MKKLLIIGGEGFLGKNLVNTLNFLQPIRPSEEHYEVIVAGRQTGLDLTNYSQTFIALQSLKPDVIVNLAAHVGSLEYVSKNHATIVHENMQMYLNLYKATSICSPKSRIINTLANCSYPGNADIQKEEYWWDGPVHPSVMSFGNSKRFLWVLAECYKSQYGMDSLCLILPNAYGINDHTSTDKVHAMNGIIIRMIKAKRAGDDSFTIWGTGKPIREWIYMPDAARIIVAALDMKFDDTYFNAGQNQGISIADTAKQVAKALNYDVNFIYDTSKPDGAPIKVLGNELFRKYFPNFSFTTYEEGIKSTIEYYEKAL